MRKYSQEELEFQRASVPGDIKEDVQFIGLTLIDMFWIVGITILTMAFSLLFPISAIAKIIFAILTFITMLVIRFFDIPYKVKRKIWYLREYSKGDGSNFNKILNVEPDGPFYKSGSHWYLTYAVTPPPWVTAEYLQKRKRIQMWGRLLRYAIDKKATITVTWDRVPDFKYDLWQNKKNKLAQNNGVEKLKNQRLNYFRQQATRGTATKVEYRMSIKIDENKLPNAGAGKNNREIVLKDIQEIMINIEGILQSAKHHAVLISGYAIPETISKHWAPRTWQTWKTKGQSWNTVTETKNTPKGKISELNDCGAIEKRPSIKEVINLGKIATFFNKVKKSKKPIHKQKTNNNSLDNIKARQETVSKDDIKSSNIAKSLSLAITSPVPTGKSFLTANIAAAYSEIVDAVYVVDLTPDKAALTYLNPVIKTNTDGWLVYICRHIPALTVFVPNENASLEYLINLLEDQAIILVDMPFNHPWKDHIFSKATPVLVFDSDYHHFIQLQKIQFEWDGIVWWNKKSQDYDIAGLLSSLGVKTPSKSFPLYPNVAKNIFYGRPYALDHKSSDFILREEEIDA